MASKNNTITTTTTSSSYLFSIPTLFLCFTFLCSLSLAFFFFLCTSPHQPNPLSLSSSSSSSSYSSSSLISQTDSIKVYVSELPRSLNYGLLDKYWSFDADSRLGSDADRDIRSSLSQKTLDFPPYPENPLIKQYSAEYWILGDLTTPPEQRTTSFAKRVFEVDEADVVFVPFFATLSAELQLGMAKSVFRKKIMENKDYERQKEVVDFVRKTEAWKRSGGRDHVFVLTG